MCHPERHGTPLSPWIRQWLAFANDQPLTGRFDDIGCDGVQVIERQDPPNLLKQPLQEPKVPLGDADDCGFGFGCHHIAGLPDTPLVPFAIQDGPQFIGLKRAYHVYKTDP